MLVTGGCGFIGSNFIRHVLQNCPSTCVHNVDKLDYNSDASCIEEAHPRYTFHYADICDTRKMLSILEDHHIDVVVHMAAQSHVDRSFEMPEQFIQDNVVGTLSLLQCAQRYGKLKLFLHFSTDEVYGDNPNENHVFDETYSLNPTNPYSASKASAEMFALAYRNSYHLPIIVSRCNNVYGPGQYPDKVIPRFIRLLRDGRPCPVHGDGLQSRSFLHVHDVCTAVLCILDKGAVGETYNVGHHREYTIVDVIGRLLEAMGKSHVAVRDATKFIQDRPYNDKRYKMNDSKLRKLGWAESITFEDGLRNLVHNIDSPGRSHIDHQAAPSVYHKAQGRSAVPVAAE